MLWNTQPVIYQDSWFCVGKVFFHGLHLSSKEEKQKSYKTVAYKVCVDDNSTGTTAHAAHIWMSVVSAKNVELAAGSRTKPKIVTNIFTNFREV